MNRHIRKACEKHNVKPPISSVEKMKFARDILQDRIDKIKQGKWLLDEAIKEEAAKVLGMANDEIEIAGDEYGQECTHVKNPLGECVYNGIDDLCWDDCLFCHQPWERK